MESSRFSAKDNYKMPYILFSEVLENIYGVQL